jgi:hypothetical protein
MKKCLVCGSVFFQKTYNQIYCSKACCKNNKINTPRVEKKCLECGNSYFVYPYRKNTSKCCSYRCFGNLRHKTRTRMMICRYCGKKFSKSKSQFKYYKGAGKYCSRDCAYKGMVKETDTKPIKDKYQRSSRKFDKEWQKQVRINGNSTCKKCGKYDPLCHTHHIKPRSRFPELKREVSNGICLCGSCHQWVHHNPKDAAKLGFIFIHKFEFNKQATEALYDLS